jgi:hypothetical protein
LTVETIRTRTAEYLEAFRPKMIPLSAWHHVASGSWEESPYHSGESVYQIAKNHFLNTWVVISTDIDEEEDEDDEEDKKEEKPKIERKPAAKKDQYQTYFELGEDSTTAIKNHLSFSRVIAICRDAPRNATPEEMAVAMYDELCEAGYGLDEW